MSGRLTRAAVRVLDRLLPESKRAEHLQTGAKGEEAAYFYLRKLGYVMVARNWRSARRRGELDLVGWDGDCLCFVEVKTRITMDVKPAEAAVDAEKQQELSEMAREYLRLLLNTSRPKGGNPTVETSPQEQTNMSPSDSPRVGKLWQRLLRKICGEGRAPSLRSGSQKKPPQIRFDVVSIYYLDGCGKNPRFALFKNSFPLA